MSKYYFISLITLVLILIILNFNHLSAQNFDSKKMDEIFSNIEEGEQGMGSFSIFKDGKEIYGKSYGRLDDSSKKPANAETVYRIGSITKTFTACIIMKLVEQKKLKLTTPLARFYPRVKNSSRITIEKLLNHSSGIYNFTNTDEYLNYMTKPLSREQLLEKVIEFGSQFDPGEDADYSNSNYVLLAMIAEEVTGKTYDELVKEMITEPLGLKRTYVGGKISSAKNEANSFDKVKKWVPSTETDMSIPLGAGNMVSTSSDINTFLYGFFQDKVVSAESRTKMMKIENGFGFGLFTIPYANKMAFGHNGGIDGFQSMAYHFPKENVTITYISNATSYAVNDIMLDALANYFGDKRPLPEFLPVMNLNSEDLDKYLGTYKSIEIPIDLTITKEGNQLQAQATGQQAFLMDAIDVNIFKFDPAKIVIEFFPQEDRMQLKQGGKEYSMQR